MNKQQETKSQDHVPVRPAAAMLRGNWPLFGVSFLEGAALMAVELIGAKLLAPYYGNSIYVWSAVLGMTLGGLALGYFFGGYIAGRFPVMRSLRAGLLAAVAVAAALPFTSTVILDATLPVSSLRIGILLSCVVILTPPLFLFGMVSPLVIAQTTSRQGESGVATGLVYGISTLGGILATFSFAFLLMPYLGLDLSCFLTAGFLLFGYFLSFVRTFN